MSEQRCQNCRKPFVRRVLRNGKLEYPSYLRKKRFCSRICGAIAAAAKRRAAA
jgi:hypothetical protein